MKTRAILRLACAGMALISSGQAWAQTAPQDVIVMRRTIASTPNSGQAQMQPLPGSDMAQPYWVVSGWIRGEELCTAQATETRLRGCVFGGVMRADSDCPQPAPETERVVEDWRGCEYSWLVTSTGDWAQECANTTRPLTAVCRRQDGEIVNDALCPSNQRPTQESGFNEQGCTSEAYHWALGGFGPWESQCSEQTVRARIVECLRYDGEKVANDKCTGNPPQSDETGSNLSGCTFTWVPTNWQLQGQACGTTVPETRTVSCQRSDGAPADNAYCTDPVPALERQTINYDGCSYYWGVGEWSQWDSTCSSGATRTRPLSCAREDGAPALLAKCPGDTKPNAAESMAITSGCTYGWNIGSWTVVPACSATSERTRIVSCQRSDGEPATDADCGAETKPTSVEAVADYSNCTFKWVAGAVGAWDSNCSASATASVDVTCVRSDDTPAAPENCDPATKPPTTISSEIYSRCATYWVSGAWSDWNSQCSSASTRVRSVGCRQERPDPQGVVNVTPENCDAGTMPSSSETTANYSNCPAYWDVGNWGWNGTEGAKSSTCSAGPQQTRTVTCKQIDTTGALVSVADGQCPAPKPEASQTLTADYNGCTYYWDIGTWGAWDSQCSQTASRTRTVVCRREDGTLSSDAFCPTPKPAASETGPNVVNCSGVLTNPGFESGLAGWSFTPSYQGPVDVLTDSKVGTYAVRLRWDNPRSAVWQTLPNTIARTYKVALWCKGGTIQIYVNSNYYINACPATYTQVTQTFTAPASAVIKIESRAGSPIIDDVVVTEN